MMRRPCFRFGVRRFMVGVAVAAVGLLLLLRAARDPTGEIIVRQRSADWRTWHRGDAVRIRLDVDRLRARNLSRGDVMAAMVETSMISPDRVDPPPGVVFVARLGKPIQYENLILKANPEGEIVYLKDVANVEAGW